MSLGKIVQIIGAVVDVEFPRDNMPKVYDALNVKGGLVLEVQQQLGDGVVRTIAMGSTDGLSRGIEVSNTGDAIKVPVGKATLGRIMNVLGDAIDEKGPIGEEEKWTIHRDAPSYDEQAPANEQAWCIDVGICAQENLKTMRGGSWLSSQLSISTRDRRTTNQEYRIFDLGFRVIRPH